MSSTPSLYQLTSHDFTPTELKFTIEISCLKGLNKRPRIQPQPPDDISAFISQKEDKERFQLYKSRLNGTKFCEVVATSDIPLFHPRVDHPCELTLTPKQGTGQRTDISCSCVIPSIKEWVRFKPSISQKTATVIFAYKLMDVSTLPPRTPALEELTSTVTELRANVIQLTEALTGLTEGIRSNFVMLSDQLAMVEAKQNKIWETFQQLCQPAPPPLSTAETPSTTLTRAPYFHPHLSKYARRE